MIFEFLDTITNISDAPPELNLGFLVFWPKGSDFEHFGEVTILSGLAEPCNFLFTSYSFKHIALKLLNIFTVLLSKGLQLIQRLVCGLKD